MDFAKVRTHVQCLQLSLTRYSLSICGERAFFHGLHVFRTKYMFLDEGSEKGPKSVGVLACFITRRCCAFIARCEACLLMLAVMFCCSCRNGEDLCVLPASPSSSSSNSSSNKLDCRFFYCQTQQGHFDLQVKAEELEITQFADAYASFQAEEAVCFFVNPTAAWKQERRLSLYLLAPGGRVWRLSGRLFAPVQAKVRMSKLRRRRSSFVVARRNLSRSSTHSS